MMSSKLQWEAVYCFQKILPLLTRWQLHHFAEETNKTSSFGCIQPDFIKKKRTPKGIPSYEIIWKDEKKYFFGLIPDDQLQKYCTTYGKENNQIEATQQLWTTIEPIDLVEKVYPELVDRFIESKQKPKRSKKALDAAENGKEKRTRKKAKPKENIASDDDEAKHSDNKNKKKISRARDNKKIMKKNSAEHENEKYTTIDKFFNRQNVKSRVYESPKIKTASKPMNLSAFSIDFDNSMANDSNSMDLSKIIDEMVSKSPTITEYQGKKLKYDELSATPRTTHINRTTKIETQTANAEKIEESMDEFDMLVMRKNPIDRIKSAHRKSIDSLPIGCSTPLLKDKRMPEPQDEKLSTPTVFNKSKYKRNSIIVSSFFATNVDDNEIDLFEQSIDYRNMDDDDNNSNTEDSETSVKSNHSKHDSKENEMDEVCDETETENDTFDRLVRMA